MPAPFGLIRYGVAPDHPRIKGIIASLHRVLDTPTIRLLGNIHIGEDITIAQLHTPKSCDSMGLVDSPPPT